MDKAKICTLDIEVSPVVAYSWGPKYDTRLIEVIEEGQIMSYSIKWIDGKQITKAQPDYKGYKKGVLSDKEISKDLWNIVDSSDILVVQNGKKFDIKYMNTRFLFHGLNAPSQYKVVDTLTEARKYLRLTSNSLDDVSAYYGLGRKLEHEGFPLWKKCMAGDKQAWGKMKKYNAHDVLLTESWYLKLRPYINNHPNLGMFTNSGEVCASCGSNKIQSRGYFVNKTTRYRRYHCQNCGSWGRSTHNVQENKPIISI